MENNTNLMELETINTSEVNTDILTLTTFKPVYNEDGTIDNSATMEALEGRAQANELIGGLCKCDNACLLAYAEDNEYFKTRGCESLAEYGEKYLGIGTTQQGVYRRVVEKFADINDDGTYTIERRFAVCGPDKLDIVARHPKFNSKEDFYEIFKALGATPKTSNKKLQELVKGARGTNEPKKVTKKDDEGKKSLEAIVVEKTKKANDFREALANIYAHCLSTEMDDKSFREWCGKMLREMEIQLKTEIESKLTKVEEPKAEEPKAEEPKAEEPKAEEPKKGKKK